MRFFYPDTPDLPLPAGHRFPRGKYLLLRDKHERDGIPELAKALAAVAHLERQLAAHKRAHMPTLKG